jgi:hypothetical protein
MEERKAYSKDFLELKDKIGILVDGINDSDATQGQKDTMMDTLSRLSFLAGQSVGMVDRYRDISEELILKIMLNITGINESVEKLSGDTASIEKTKIILEFEVMFLGDILDVLKKIRNNE